MDPLSISASIAGLIALTTGLIKLTDTLRSNFKEDVLQLVVSVSQDIELLHGVLLRVQTWADSVQSNKKFHSQLLNLSPFVSNCTDVIKRIGGELLALKEVAKKRGFKRLYSTVSLNEKIKALDASRLSLSEAKTTLLLALSTKEQDISTSLDSIQTKLENIYENISSSNSSDTKLSATEFDGPQSFEEWLQSFSGEGRAGELSDYQQKKKLQRKRKRDALPENMAQNHTKIYVKIVDMKNKDGRTATETLLLDTRANIIDIIHQLHDRGYEDVCGFQTEDGSHKYGPFERIETPPMVYSTPGPSSYDPRDGLKINEHERLIDYFNNFLDYQAPRDDERHPSRIAVRRKEVSGGLEITDLHDHEFSKVDICFDQSLRLPADNQVYDPPPTFGTFPLLSVSDFKSKLPPAMVEKGGFFFPMMQREGLKLSFDRSIQATCPDEAFAIRLYAGSVNAVSGSLASKSISRGQDYIVAPEQSSLDGIRTNEDHVKQFVAMPLTWGYSVEKQVTGSEVVGGIQLEIAPKLKTAVNFLTKLHSHSHRDPLRLINSISLDDGFNFCHGIECHDFLIDKFKSPYELGISKCFMDPWLDSGFHLKSNSIIYEEIQGRLQARNDTLGITSSYFRHALRSRFVHELTSHLPQYSGTTPGLPVVLHPILPLQFRIKYSIKAEIDRPSDEVTYRCSPFTDLRDFLAVILKRYILPITSLTVNSVTINHRSLSDLLNICEEQDHTPIIDVIPSGATVLIGPYDTNIDDGYRKLTSRLEAAIAWRRVYRPGCLRHIRFEALSLNPVGSAGWEMGIGVQGNISQSIVKTKNEKLWRWERSRFINIQIINAVAFEKVTGLSYNCPIPLSYPIPSPKSDFLFGSYEDISTYDDPYPPVHGGGGKEERSYTTATTTTTTINISSVPTAPPFQTISQLDCGEKVTFDINLTKGAHNIGCACCETRSCDTIIQPCNHIFCRHCIEYKMTTVAKGLICDACGMSAKTAVQFSATMELPIYANLSMDAPEHYSQQIGQLLPESHADGSLDGCLYSELTHQDLLPILPILSPFLPHKTPQDLTPGHYVHLISGRAEILDALILRLLELPIEKRVSLLYQLFEAGPLIRGSDLWYILKSNTIQTFLRLVPDASAMRLYEGNFSRLVAILKPRECYHHSYWLYLYSGDIFRWINRSGFSPSTMDISGSNNPLQTHLTEDAIDAIINYLQSTNTPVPVLNSFLLSLKPTSNAQYTVKKLVSIGADIKARDNRGNTISDILDLRYFSLDSP